MSMCTESMTTTSCCSRAELPSGLRDLRPHSPTAGRRSLVELSGRDRRVVVIPHGVAHGFFFPEPSLHVYSMTEYWNPGEGLGCRWDDPDLEIPWAVQGDPLLSERDAGLGSLKELLHALWPVPARAG